MTGYHLVQHTGGYFEYVPDEYAALRDTYIQSGTRRSWRRATQTNATGRRSRKPSRVTGLKFLRPIEDNGNDISVATIWNTGSVSEDVRQGWWMSGAHRWTGPREARGKPSADGRLIASGCALCSVLVAGDQFDLRSEAARWGGASYPPEPVHQTTAQFIPGLQAAFVQGPPDDSTSQVNQRHALPGQHDPGIAFIVQSLLHHGDNPRLRLPLQVLRGIVVAWLRLKNIAAESDTGYLR